MDEDGSGNGVGIDGILMGIELLLDCDEVVVEGIADEVNDGWENGAGGGTSIEDGG